MKSFLDFLPPIPFLKRNSSVVDVAAEQEAANTAILKQFSQGLVTTQDIIAPEAIEIDFTYQKINSTYTRTLFVAGYPRTVPSNWLSPLINFPHQLDISMFIYPVDVREVLDNLKRKITEMEAEITSDIRQGKISNIDTEVKLEDARVIREQLAKGAERFYQFGLYVTIQARDKEELDRVTKAVQSSLGSLLIVSKKATLQMDEGFKTTLPMGLDHLLITRNMDTTSLATTMPFTSSELTMDTGIVYGINEHNDSLVVFDRFKMESFNMMIFAKSGAGKSYTVKLEILRQMMFDTEVLILDPEHEYEDLAKAVGGEYINFSFDSQAKINPFDLSNMYEEGENELGQKIIGLHSLLKIMLGQMTPTQDAMLDRALVAAYKAKGITPDPATQTNEPPLLEDFYKALIGMENTEANDIAARLEKYVTGSFRGIFDKPSNINLTNQLTVFSVKDMEEELRPIAMFIILDFIWTRIKRKLKKRILVVDEAWYFMRYPDAAYFMQSIAKRARKYYLGLTTITQDVEDFMGNEFGKAIVSNASIKFLMKQSPSSVPILAKTFYLSEGEKQLLVAADVGEGIFFAGANHVALRVVASPEEHAVITTAPEEVLRRRTAEALASSSTGGKVVNSLTGGQVVQRAAPVQQPQQLQQQQAQVVPPQVQQPPRATLPPIAPEQPQQTEASAPQQQVAQVPGGLPTPTPPPGMTVPKFAGSYSIDDYQPPASYPQQPPTNQ